MKTFENGEMSDSSGPPLEHEEWVEAQKKAHAADQRRLDHARQSGGRTSASATTDDLESLTVPELKDRARDAEVDGFSTMNKAELIDALKK